MNMKNKKKIKPIKLIKYFIYNIPSDYYRIINPKKSYN